MLLALFSYWPVGLTTAYVLAFPLEMGEKGLWWGLVTGLATAAILILGRFLKLTSGTADYTKYSDSHAP